MISCMNKKWFDRKQVALKSLVLSKVIHISQQSETHKALLLQVQRKFGKRKLSKGKRSLGGTLTWVPALFMRDLNIWYPLSKRKIALIEALKLAQWRHAGCIIVQSCDSLT